MFNYLKFVFTLYILVFTSNCLALTYRVPKSSNIVGTIEVITLKNHENNLQAIARKYNLGINELMAANPNLNPKKIKPGTKLIIPTQFVLPSEPHEGIVLNLAEFRLYYFSKDQHTVTTLPVGIGRLGWRTPVGTAKIVKKRENPTWTPPPSIRKHYARKGKTLPPYMPSGPNNPLGYYAMNLSWPNYLIHGTNKPTSVGLRSSSGCVRMYPEDIEQLFILVDINTPVRIVHEPIKIGKKYNDLYIEAHEPFKEKYYNDDISEIELLENIIEDYYERFQNRIDWNTINKNIEKAIGYPTDITD
jgi:L,D-transpeptidase ErfK/SrfK